MTSLPPESPISDDEDRRRRAIFGLVGGFLAVLVAIVAVQSITDGGGSGGPQRFPVGVLTTLDGQEFDLAAIDGRPTVVNFFASWCAPCRAEMPSFEEVFQQRGAEVAFIGINARETDVDQARQLVAETGVTYTILLGDNGRILEEVGASGLPVTIFVDDEGNVAETHVGILRGEDLDDKISELIR